MSTGDPVCSFCGGQLPGHNVGCRVTDPSFTVAGGSILWNTGVYTSPPSPPPKTDSDQLFDILKEYLGDEVFAARFTDCIDMIKRKNADYTQGVQKRDRIAAFRRIGKDIDVPMTKVWAIFAQKHWGAVMKFVKDGQVESEPIGGRINDLINYFVLLGAIIDDEGER